MIDLDARLPKTHSPRSPASPIMVVVAALLVGLAIRLLFLGSKSLWLDEGMSIRFATDPILSLTESSDHSHPPLYYILLHYWLPLGQSEFMLRLSSALVGAFAIPLSYRLAADLAGRKVAYTTMWLVALAPLLVWYAQELRSYSLLVLLGLLTTVATARLLVHQHAGWRVSWWLLFVLATSAALYTHYAAVLLAAAQVGVLATLHLQQRVTHGGLWWWLSACLAVMLLYLPWLLSPRMSSFAAFIFTDDFYPVELVSMRLAVSPLVAGWLLVGVVVLGLLVAAGASLWLLQRGLALWLRLAASPSVRYGVLALFLLATVVSVVPRVYTIKKLVVDLWPYGLLVVGWLFPWQRANRVAIVVLLAASLVGSLANVTVVPKDRWREVAAFLTQHAEPNDMVWVLPRYHITPLNYYLQDTATPVVMPSLSVDLSDAELAALAGEGARIWLIYHTVNFSDSDPERNVERWLRQNFDAADELHVYRMDVTLYTPRP